MALGLLQEAIIARERREAQAQAQVQGGSISYTSAPPRRVTRRSQNSRYDRDLSNIVSFDPPPAKSTLSSATKDPGRLQRQGSNELEKYRYREADNPERAVEVGGRGLLGYVDKGEKAGLWKKLSVPEKVKPLDPALEEILWPKARSRPHHSSAFKTPSPPEPIIGSPRPYDQPYPTPVSYQPPPVAVSQPRISEDQVYGVPQRPYYPAQSIQRDVCINIPPQPPYLPLPPSLAAQCEQPHTLYEPQAPHSATNPHYHQYHTQPSAPSHSACMTSTSGRASSHNIPPAAHSRGLSIGQSHPHSYKTQPIPEIYNPPAGFWMPNTGHYIYQGNPPQPIYYAQAIATQPDQSVQVIPRQLPLSDPTLRPVPVFDEQLRQWILLPRAPASPTLTIHQSSDDLPSSSPSFMKSRKRPADSSSDRSIPRSLEVAFQNLDTPTRPRRVPTDRDMRGKKSGRVLIKSLEGQAESSEADELNIRSTPARAKRDYGDEYHADEPSLVHRRVKNRATNLDKSVPRSILRHPQTVVEEDDDMLGDGEDDSIVYRSRSGPQRPHKRIKKDDRQPCRKNHKQRHRSDVRARTPSRINQDQSRHHNDHKDHSTSRSARVHHTPQHRQPSYSPSPTETASTDDEESFTSPSDTPSSPSPAAEHRVPLTQSAWAGYDVPQDLQQNGSHPPHSRSRSRKVHSVPLPVHQRPRDAQGKWLPYANTRSESPEDTEMEVEDELDGEADREDIEGFSSPSQEDRYGAARARQGLSPVIEEEEEEEVSKGSRSTGSSGKKKAVRWKEVLEEEEPVRMRRWEGAVAKDRVEEEMKVGAHAVENEVSVVRADRLGQHNGVEEGAGAERKEEGVGAFGEGFFDPAGGDVGFTIWRDGY